MSADGAGPVFTLATGPVGSTPATLAALGQPVLHHTDPVFRALYAETVELLRVAFGTDGDPVILQGEAVVGLEAVAASLIAPGDVVLNLVSGIYGRRPVLPRHAPRRRRHGHPAGRGSRGRLTA
jgi:pyridoxamine---pyruvate transaminase